MRRLGSRRSSDFSRIARWLWKPKLKPKSPDCQFYGFHVLHFSMLWEMAGGKSRREKNVIQCDLPTYEDLTSFLCTMESSANREDGPLLSGISEQSFVFFIHFLGALLFHCFYCDWIVLFKNPIFLNSYDFCHIFEWFSPTTEGTLWWCSLNCVKYLLRSRYFSKQFLFINSLFPMSHWGEYSYLFNFTEKEAKTQNGREIIQVYTANK